MSITCKFKLSRSSIIYYSGEEIAGCVTICSTKLCQLEEIKLEFRGQTKVQWWEIDKNNEKIMHNDFSTHELSNKTLCNSQQMHVSEQLKLDSLNCKELQPHVEYTFDFCYLINQQIPATFSCQYGQTDYGLRLQIQRPKRANKEFHQRVVVKNKLDLTQGILYKKTSTAYDHNKFGQISFHVPCSGFTPGQKIPYYFRYQATQNACKMLIQFNSYITCRTQSNCYKYKQVKQIINYKKHMSTEVSSYVNVPLHTHISSTNGSELILSIRYTLEAFLLNGNKEALLRATIPLTIGTTPCYVFKQGLDNYMCYDNFGSSSNELSNHHYIAKFVDFDRSVADHLFDSFWIIPRRGRNRLRESFNYCYKKIIKSF